MGTSGIPPGPAGPCMAPQAWALDRHEGAGSFVARWHLAERTRRPMAHVLALRCP